MALRKWIQQQVGVLDKVLRPWADRGPWQAGAFEFLLFGLKQAWACLFGGAMVALLVTTHLFWPEHAPIARYDFLVLAAVGLQVLMLALKLEHWDEAAVILAFHVVGTLMELFKTAHGSWIYPEPSLLRIGGVPLFSGFMYSCVGSYIARIWRLFHIRFEHYPPEWTAWLLALLAYANFFTHQFIPDIRLGLFAFSGVIFWRTWFVFQPDAQPRRMPFLLGAGLVSLFIWFAENAGTFANAWIYPAQRSGWRMVPIAKLGAWYFLMLLSFVLVSVVRRVERAPADGQWPSR